MNLDTNILIAYFTGDPQVIPLLKEWRAQGVYLYVSIVVVTELLSFESLTEVEKQEMKRFIKENFFTIPFNENLIDLTAHIRKTSKLKLPDAIIAATALHTDTALLTRNLKDFKKVKGLKVFTA